MKYLDYQQKRTTKGSHIMVYGDPKKGKSTLVSQLAEPCPGATVAPDGFKLKWFSMDKGHDVIDKLTLTARENNVELFILPDSRTFQIAQATMKKVVDGNKYNLCDIHGQDECSTCKTNKSSFSIVELGNLAPDEIAVFDPLGQVITSAVNLLSKGKSTVDFDKLDDLVFNYDTWRKLWALMDRILTEIQNANYNCICIAHSLKVNMENGDSILVPYVGTTEFSRKVGGYFGHIVYCDTTNQKHQFGSRTTYKLNTLTGSRTDIAIEDFSVPSLRPFFDGTIGKPPTIGGGGNAADLLAKLKGQVTGVKE